MRVLFTIAFLAYVVTPAITLDCFQCGLSTSTCISTVKCKKDELCYSRNNTVRAIIYSSGCISPDKCGREVTESLAGVQYRMTTFCCNFNYCNGATATQVSLLAGSIAAAIWLTSFL